jgi:hypothetical protein
VWCGVGVWVVVRGRVKGFNHNMFNLKFISNSCIGQASIVFPAAGRRRHETDLTHPQPHRDISSLDAPPRMNRPRRPKQLLGAAQPSDVYSKSTGCFRCYYHLQMRMAAEGLQAPSAPHPVQAAAFARVA